MSSSHSSPTQPFASGKVDSTPRSRLVLSGLKVILFLIVATGLGWTHNLLLAVRCEGIYLGDFGGNFPLSEENILRRWALFFASGLFFVQMWCLESLEIACYKFEKKISHWALPRCTKIWVLDTNIQLLNQSIWRGPSPFGLQASWVSNLSYWLN